eukprot:g3239.t1
MMQGGIIALTLTVLILPGFVAAQSGDNIGWNTVVAIGWTTEHANEFFETLFGSRNYTKQEVSLSIAGNMSGSNSCKTNYHFGSTGQRSKSIKYRFKFYPNGNGDDNRVICSKNESINSADECIAAARALGYNIEGVETRTGADWAAHGCFQYGVQFYFFDNNIYRLHPSPTSKYIHRKYICKANPVQEASGVDIPLSSKMTITQSKAKCPTVLYFNVGGGKRQPFECFLHVLTNCFPFVYIEDEKQELDRDINARALLAAFCPRNFYNKPYIHHNRAIICEPLSMRQKVDKATYVNFQNMNRNILRPISNLTIIQIGAHVGNTINDPIFEMADENMNLILIEPVPFLFKQLKRNYMMRLPQHFDRITFINKAVSDYVGKIKFTFPSRKNDFTKLPFWVSQIGSVDPQHLKKHVPDLLLENLEVATTTVNEIVRNSKLDELYLLKIDAEGMD